ncbi:hypothetical protein Q31a_21210 [Aureliella helgolandensis]|uniref:Uncharacterized protein n=1 Tax=Aureliella helgolandensis TaxID=2527968 RepID=A0A518G5E9_9BACT|nr:hypothetical protein Q31a_21210 [Aureliella helgolandensis]
MTKYVRHSLIAMGANGERAARRTSPKNQKLTRFTVLFAKTGLDHQALSQPCSERETGCPDLFPLPLRQDFPHQVLVTLSTARYLQPTHLRFLKFDL